MSTLAQGKVTAMRRDRKGLQLDDGNWYSSFNAIGSDVNKGDEVSFTYVAKGRFNNIQGDIKVTGGSTGGTSPGPAGQEAPRRGGGFNRGKFPIDPLDGQRSIIRQNAVSQARELFLAITPESKLTKMDKTAVVDEVLSLARMVEAYTSGDLDLQEANRLLHKKQSESLVDDVTGG